ncbi:MAG: hypothetical protein K0Q57_315 [Gammaproteobacteria bacterium]|jgi:hypothetical protein|nr:hypothetical protein [Gammaproteobacteria bacterium]
MQGLQGLHTTAQGLQATAHGFAAAHGLLVVWLEYWPDAAHGLLRQGGVAAYTLVDKAAVAAATSNLFFMITLRIFS